MGVCPHLGGTWKGMKRAVVPLSRGRTRGPGPLESKTPCHSVIPPRAGWRVRVWLRMRVAGRRAATGGRRWAQPAAHWVVMSCLPGRGEQWDAPSTS